MLTAGRLLGPLVALKATDLAVRGPGGGAGTWVAAAAALAVGGALLLAGVERRAWLVVLAACVLTVADSPVELRRQHVVLLGLVAVAALVSRDEGERLLLWRVQLTALYGVAALAKLDEPYLSGTVVGAAVAAAPFGRGWLGVLPLPVLLALSVGLLLTELLLAAAPWVPRLRGAALVAATGFHAAAVPLAGDEPLVALRLVVFGGVSLVVLLAVTGRLPPGPADRQPAPPDAARVG